MTFFGTPGQRCWLEKGTESWNRALCSPASPASRWELQKAAPAGPVPARRAPSEAGALQEARPWFGFQVLPSPHQAGQTRRWDHKSPQVLNSYHVAVTVLVALLYLLFHQPGATDQRGGCLPLWYHGAPGTEPPSPSHLLGGLCSVWLGKRELIWQLWVEGWSIVGAVWPIS